MPTEMTQGATSALADPELNKAAQEGKKWEAGRWVLPDGSPTYNIERGADNTDAVKKVDWMTYSGWRGITLNATSAMAPMLKARHSRRR